MYIHHLNCQGCRCCNFRAVMRFQLPFSCELYHSYVLERPRRNTVVVLVIFGDFFLPFIAFGFFFCNMVGNEIRWNFGL